ncbi:MAG: hypothetical protein JW982_15220 [Spirochaetes bacterium]|nr:hypothetical protein [Spirochaetota bacterium]
MNFLTVYEKIISKKSVFFAGLLLFISCQLLFNMLFIPAFVKSSGGEGLIDMKFLYNADQIIATIFKYSPETFRIHFYIRITDSFFPLSYMIMYSSAIYLLLHNIIRNGEFKIMNKFNWFYLLPVAAALSDYTENFFIISMMSSFPDISPLTASISGIIAFMKFSAVIICMIAIIILLIVKMFQFVSMKVFTAHRK